MSQNTSNPYEQAYAAAPADAAANPYMNMQYAAPPPDLDAAAPSLRNEEQQRVNRKALVFLAGIVGLLGLLAVLVFKGVTGKETVEKPTEERVSIPTLAEQAPPLPPEPVVAEPIALQPRAAQSYESQLPPLPPPDLEERSYRTAGAASQTRAPSLLERRMGLVQAAGEEGVPGGYGMAPVMGAGMPGQTPVAPAAPNTVSDAASRPTSARALRRPDTLLVRGTALRCTLETRIISEADGFTACVLTEPVYSINGRSLLLQRGSKIYGTYKASAKGNRIEVAWDRITTPNGFDVSMLSPGVDGLGSAGVPGHLDSHWASRLTSAVMVSLLSDAFKYAAAENGPASATVSQGVVVVSPFESNTARTLDRIANQAAEQAMSRPPTVTINQGTVLNVYVARDVDFSEVLGR